MINMKLDYSELMKKCNNYLDNYKGINNDYCSLNSPVNSKYLNQAEETLGFSLPQNFKDFYLQTNGLKFFYWNRSRSLDVNMKILPLQNVFGAWKKKKNGSFGLMANKDWSGEVFKDILWFDNDEQIRSKADFKLIKELKLLENISGESTFITIHFSEKKHKLYLVTEFDIIPFKINFEDYIKLTFQFCGANNWWALYLENREAYLADYNKIEKRLKKYFPN